jgi:Tfp pilus assembly protein FimT
LSSAVPKDLYGGLMKCNKSNLRNDRLSETGFSLLETLVVISIAMVAASLFIPNINTSLRNSKVSNGYDLTLTTIRQAREAAVSERRVYIVTFTSPNGITVAPKTAATNAMNISQQLPAGVQFSAQTGIPNTNATAPDHLGTGPATGAICFDIGVSSTCTTAIYFWPDGTSRDDKGNMNNGVVYIARPGEYMSTRAITVWGASGRIRGWHINKNATAGTTSWSQQ